MNAPRFLAHDDPAVVDRLVAEHLDLADGIARRYAGRGIDTQDLTQVARLALVKAARRFDPGLGFSFACYAAPSISGEIKRHFRDAGWMIRPPRRLQELSAEYRRVASELTHQHGRHPTEAEMVAALGIDRHELRRVEATGELFACVSLDSPAPGEGSSGDGGSRVGPGRGEESMRRIEEQDWLARAMSGLGERERVVLGLRFAQLWTQDQIADHLGLSQMQVSRILRATLSNLRSTLMGSLATG